MKPKTISRILAILCAVETAALACLCTVFISRTNAPPHGHFPLYTPSRT